MVAPRSLFQNLAPMDRQILGSFIGVATLCGGTDSVGVCFLQLWSTHYQVADVVAAFNRLEAAGCIHMAATVDGKAEMRLTQAAISEVARLHTHLLMVNN
jgi:hypothetical protein